MRVAIVEDDINMRKSLEIALADFSEFEVESFKSAKDAIKKIDTAYDVIVTDINMPGMDGIEFIKTLENDYPATFDFVIMTGNATLQRAIDSLRIGVKDFLLKPFEAETLVEAIKRSVKVKALKKQKAAEPESDTGGFVGISSQIEGVKRLALKAAKTDATVILLGESGVGKEVFANFIHTNSQRSEKPFVAINMAAIPENLIESELFGFVKGAFTDAHADKAGKFEMAQGGTIFLDEIGEMPYHLQAKLLRALQEREVTRLGDKKSIKIDVRILSATNANLPQKITAGEFREDLYYRLNTIPIEIPPLRERKDEILSIASAALSRAVESYALGEKHFSESAMQVLMAYHWPGNIRELLSVVERAAILSEGEAIEPEELFLETRTAKKSIASMEEALIREVMQDCADDKEAAAKMLGMGLKTLESKLTTYKIGE